MPEPLAAFAAPVASLSVFALAAARSCSGSGLSAPHRSPAQENLFGVKTQATISPCRVDMQRKKAVREMELVSSAPLSLLKH